MRDLFVNFKVMEMEFHCNEQTKKDQRLLKFKTYLAFFIKEINFQLNVNWKAFNEKNNTFPVRLT